MANQFSLAFPTSTAKIGDGNRDQRVDARSQIKSNTACKDSQKGPDHRPTNNRSRFFGLRGHLKEPCRSSLYRKPLGMPFWIAQGITIDLFVAKLNGHPGRRVTTDSCQSCSVKYD